MNQNGRSRSSGIIGHDAPEYPTSWLERIEVVAQAREIAQTAVGFGPSGSDDARPEQLFTAAMTVKYGSPMVAKIWRRCNSAVSH
jgi:hypothetical protein